MEMAIEPSTTLADLVTGHPDLAGELGGRSLDYCCGGQRTLAEACRDRGLDPENNRLFPLVTGLGSSPADADGNSQ